MIPVRLRIYVIWSECRSRQSARTRRGRQGGAGLAPSALPPPDPPSPPRGRTSELEPGTMPM